MRSAKIVGIGVSGALAAMTRNAASGAYALGSRFHQRFVNADLRSNHWYFEVRVALTNRV